MAVKEKYINPYTDFGFKKLFGSEPNKDLLIDFLNELLKGEKTIADLQYTRNEHLGKTEEERIAIFDLSCEGPNGEKFIIELQRVRQQYFKDRSIFYATYAIQEQASKNVWNYQLSEVYTIGIMDFAFDGRHPHKFMHKIKLLDTENHETFYDKLTFIYLEMVKFNKSEEELTSHFDKWLYLLKNLNQFQEIPAVLQERIFRKVFDVAEVANLNEEEMDMYQESLKRQRDLHSVVETAVNEAVEEAVKEAQETKKAEIAREFKKNGASIELICKSTGLTPEQVEKL